MRLIFDLFERRKNNNDNRKTITKTGLDRNLITPRKRLGFLFFVSFFCKFEFAAKLFLAIELRNEASRCGKFLNNVRSIYWAYPRMMYIMIMD